MAERTEPLVVGLGFPGLQAEPYVEALRAVHPCVEPVVLPFDEGANWLASSPSEPYEEPPSWAASHGPARREALARVHALLSLHAPLDLVRLAPRLEWVHAVGAGVDAWVAARVPSDRVFVTNSSGLGARSIAEFVLGRLLQIWKSFRALDEAQREHAWRPTPGRTFGGTTLGIVGLGAIGEEVAVRARAFGVRVLGSRRSFRPGMTSDVVDELYGMDDLHTLLGQCDSVVVAAPHTPETENLINRAAIAAMRPGAVLVNVARGPLVEEAAVVEAMNEGRLGAAVLDVFREEPLPAESPFWDLPNTYVSPHGAVAPDRYLEDLFDLFRENVRRYVVGEPLRNVVDMDALGFPRTS